MKARRRVLLAVPALLALPARAQSWPDRPLRVIVPFAPGSFTDTAARLLGQEMMGPLGQPVVVENRGGAGGTLGTTVAVRAPADGHTLLVSDNSLAMSVGLYPNLPYDPLRDLQQVTRVADSPSILLARPSLGVRDLPALLALARQRPGHLAFGSGGQGSSAHLAMEQLMAAAGIRLTHVPFRGIAAAIAEVIAGRVDMAIASLASGIAQVREGTLLGLAVSGDRRDPALPQVPTFAEAGVPRYSMTYWFGLSAPRGLPPEVLARLNHEATAALRQPKLVAAFAQQGAVPTPTTPQEAEAHLAREVALWRAVTQTAGIRLE